MSLMRIFLITCVSAENFNWKCRPYLLWKWPQFASQFGQSWLPHLHIFPAVAAMTIPLTALDFFLTFRDALFTTLPWDCRHVRGHLVESVRNMLRDLRTDIAAIPGGLVSVLQPLDVSLNKHLKDNVRRLYPNWMAGGQHALTPGGKIKRPSAETPCGWISEAWRVISHDVVRESFKRTGISNALDASKGMLWNSKKFESTFSNDDHVLTDSG